MSVLIDVGFVFGLALLSIIPLTKVSARVDRAVTRLALRLFRDRVTAEGRHRKQRSMKLQHVHAESTYPVYASLTLLYAVIVGVAASFIAVWAIQQGLAIAIEGQQAVRSIVPPELSWLVPPGSMVWRILPPSLWFLVPTSFTQLTTAQVLTLQLLSGLTVGPGGVVAAYYARWWFVSNLASKRAVLIDESLARTIAFIYALSRSGMMFPEVMRTVGTNRKAFGQSAEEIGIIVKDMDLFGADLVTAMQRTAQRTPSEQFAEFAENFANVLQSGQNIADYLRDQYEQHQSERIANQEQLLELFTALGEGYVAGLVAGPLFFITIVVIVGILTGGFYWFLQLVVYLVIPLANLGFVFYLGTISEPLKSFEAPIQQGVESRSIDVRRANEPGAAPITRTDGGTVDRPYDLETNRVRFAAYQRLQRVRKAVLNPIETVLREPKTILVAVVPLALLLFIARVWPMVFGELPLTVRALDDLVIQSGVLVVGSYAVVRELRTRRIRAIEVAVPDLLERLASTNEAGMTFTESLRRVDKSDLGTLDVEVHRLLTDINLGARTERALYRFNERIGSTTIARIVALISNAMKASGHLGPVIRIAADEAREDRRLKKKRRQEMFLYVVIIYLSFMVFLVIAIALQTILIPAIPSAKNLASLTPSGNVGLEFPINPAEGPAKSAFSLVLFHAALIQAMVSGFIAGQMGEGSVLDGAKHVTILVSMAYLLFLLIG